MIILVDTSVWIDHFRRGSRRLSKYLEDTAVVCHPFLIGELACGNLKNRNEILRLLRELPKVHVAEDDEVMRFVEGDRLFGRGLGWTDVHLLASARLSGCALWTKDKSLSAAATSLKIAAPIS